MIQQLIYTSAPKGLKQGSYGFCTVATTPGMNANLADRLEALSGYRHLFAPTDLRNPVNYSSLQLTVGGQRLFVLSRVADAGLDYSKRTNKIAHHLVFNQAELPPCGPAALCLASGVFQNRWTGDPKIIPPQPIPVTTTTPGKCESWEQITGDAGWGGYLAQPPSAGPQSPVVILYRPGMSILPLLEESLALLSPESRWQISFSTFFTRLPPGVECRWRCMVADTPEAAAQRVPGTIVIDLCQLSASKTPAPSGPLVEAARTGVLHQPKSQPQSRRPAAAPGPQGNLPTSFDDAMRGGAEIQLEPLHENGIASIPPPLSGGQANWSNQQFKRKSAWPIWAGLAAVILVLLSMSIGWGVYSRNKGDKQLASVDGEFTPGPDKPADPTKAEDAATPSASKQEPDRKSSENEQDDSKKKSDDEIHEKHQNGGNQTASSSGTSSNVTGRQMPGASEGQSPQANSRDAQVTGTGPADSNNPSPSASTKSKTISRPDDSKKEPLAVDLPPLQPNTEPVILPIDNGDLSSDIKPKLLGFDSQSPFGKGLAYFKIENTDVKLCYKNRDDSGMGIAKLSSDASGVTISWKSDAIAYAGDCGQLRNCILKIGKQPKQVCLRTTDQLQQRLDFVIDSRIPGTNTRIKHTFKWALPESPMIQLKSVGLPTGELTCEPAKSVPGIEVTLPIRFGSGPYIVFVVSTSVKNNVLHISTDYSHLEGISTDDWSAVADPKNKKKVAYNNIIAHHATVAEQHSRALANVQTLEQQQKDSQSDESRKNLSEQLVKAEKDLESARRRLKEAEDVKAIADKLPGSLPPQISVYLLVGIDKHEIEIARTSNDTK